MFVFIKLFVNVTVSSPLPLKFFHIPLHFPPLLLSLMCTRVRGNYHHHVFIFLTPINVFLSFRSSFNSSTGGVNPTFNSSSPKRSSMSKQQPPIARVLPVNRCDGYIDRYFTFSSPFPSTGVMVVTGTVPAGFFPAVFPRGFFPARSFPRRFFPRRYFPRQKNTMWQAILECR